MRQRTKTDSAGLEGHVLELVLFEVERPTKLRTHLILMDQNFVLSNTRPFSNR